MSLRVLCVVNYYKPAYVYGGPVQSISSMCEGLVKAGADVTVLTTDSNGSRRLNVPLGRPTYVDGVEAVYHSVVQVPPRSFFYSPRLAAACADDVRRHDVVILDALWTHVMGPAVRACRSAGVPYVLSLQGQLLPWALRQRWLRKRAYLRLRGRSYLKGAAALHCTDETEADAVRRLGIETPALVVPNGLHIERFARLPPRGELRRSLGIPAEAAVLLFLGRLHRKKRPEIAVETLAAARAKGIDAYLIIAGPDEERMSASLTAQASHRNCQDRLRIVGLLNAEQTLGALADADLLVMPSAPESENFGMSAVEAMAAGVPVLLSEGVPVGRCAEAAGAGCMVAATPDAFTEATTTLLLDPARLKRMGECGRALVRDRFDVSRTAATMLAALEAIARGERKRLRPAS